MPISNLLIASKLLELLDTRQVVGHLKSNNLLHDRQSAYRFGFSTNTAVLLVLPVIVKAVDEGDVAILALFNHVSSVRIGQPCDFTPDTYISHSV